MPLSIWVCLKENRVPRNPLVYRSFLHQMALFCVYTIFRPTVESTNTKYGDVTQCQESRTGPHLAVQSHPPFRNRWRFEGSLQNPGSAGPASSDLHMNSQNCCTIGKRLSKPTDIFTYSFRIEESFYITTVLRGGRTQNVSYTFQCVFEGGLEM